MDGRGSSESRAQTSHMVVATTGELAFLRGINIFEHLQPFRYCTTTLFLFIYFIFGCVGSSFLCEGFL